MASDKDNKPSQDKDKPGVQAPDWANGLRQLYDSVVDEPIPDSFKDLLAQFDDDDAGQSNEHRNT